MKAILALEKALPVPILSFDGWSAEPMRTLWKLEKNLCPFRESNPDFLIIEPITQSLYLMAYSGSQALSQPHISTQILSYTLCFILFWATSFEQSRNLRSCTQEWREKPFIVYENLKSMFTDAIHIFFADITCLLHAAASFMFLFTASPIHAFSSF